MTMQAFFQTHPAAAVAFSGGVDSAWLLHEAVRYAQKTAAYFVRTPFQPAFELDDARRTSRLLGAALNELLNKVVDGELPNEREALLRHLQASPETDGQGDTK